MKSLILITRIIFTIMFCFYFQGKVEGATIEDTGKEKIEQIDTSVTLSRAKRELKSTKFDFYPQDGGYKIPYVSNISDKRFKEKLDEAIEDFDSNTCIKLIPRSSESKYINFYEGTVCSSPVGAVESVTDISLAESCWTKGTIIHEIMHALGFFHEHSRPDRDDYVIIKTENIAPSDVYNFDKYSEDLSNVPDAFYDTWSIMHYSSYHLSMNGQPTMTNLDGEILNVQREGFSKRDVTRINSMYECSPIITGSGGSEDPGKGCEDVSSAFSCHYWKENGQCISNPVFMNQQCCATCTEYLATATFTTTTENPLCKDTATSCSIYSRIGLCETNTASMVDLCCRTCRLDHLLTVSTIDELVLATTLATNMKASTTKPKTTRLPTTTLSLSTTTNLKTIKVTTIESESPTTTILKEETTLTTEKKYRTSNFN